MVKSEQSRKFGDKMFEQLQAEVTVAQVDSLKDFRAVIDPDLMGFDGKEGIDDDN